MKQERENGILSVFQTIASENKEREAREKTCIHVTDPKRVQDLCAKFSLNDADFYDVMSVSSSIANGMRLCGVDDIETAFKGQLIVQVESLRTNAV